MLLAFCSIFCNRLLQMLWAIFKRSGNSAIIQFKKGKFSMPYFRNSYSQCLIVQIDNHNFHKVKQGIQTIFCFAGTIDYFYNEPFVRKIKEEKLFAFCIDLKSRLSIIICRKKTVVRNFSLQFTLEIAFNRLDLGFGKGGGLKGSRWWSMFIVPQSNVIVV